MSSGIKGEQIKDGTVCRIDLNTTTIGQAVITRIIQGQGITISSTGADSGTGDVTININNSSLTNNYIPKWNNTNQGYENSKIYDDGTNVGIGTSTPISPLDITYTDNNFNAGVSVTNLSTGTWALPGINVKDSNKVTQAQFSYVPTNYANPALRNMVLFNSVYKGVSMGFVSSTTGGGSATYMGDIFFQTGPSIANRHLFISGATGFIGVGNTSPSEKLEVGGNIKLTGKLIEAVYGNITTEVNISNILSLINSNVACIYYFKTTLTAQTTLNLASLSNLVENYEYSIVIKLTTNSSYTLYVTDSLNGGGSIQGTGNDTIISIKFRKIGSSVIITSFR